MLSFKREQFDFRSSFSFLFLNTLSLALILEVHSCPQQLKKSTQLGNNKGKMSLELQTLVWWSRPRYFLGLTAHGINYLLTSLFFALQELFSLEVLWLEGSLYKLTKSSAQVFPWFWGKAALLCRHEKQLWKTSFTLLADAMSVGFWNGHQYYAWEPQSSLRNTKNSLLASFRLLVL